MDYMALHIECRFNKIALLQCYLLAILPVGFYHLLLPSFCLRIEKHEVCFEEKSKELTQSLVKLKSTQMDLQRAEEITVEIKERISTLKHDKSHLQKYSDDQEKKISFFIR